MRKSFFIILLTACTNTSLMDKPDAGVPPKRARNFVCERLAITNPSATCDPEYTDVGEYHVHTARVIVGNDSVACGINTGQVSVVCDGLFVQPKSEQPKSPPTKK